MKSKKRKYVEIEETRGFEKDKERWVKLLKLFDKDIKEIAKRLFAI